MRGHVCITMFKEHMRKLKLPAMVLIVLATFGSIMELILLIMMGYDNDPAWILPSIWQAFFAPVVAFIFSEILMKDYHTRNGSDYYHALPVSRRSVLISAVFAVFCWTVVFMIIPVLIQGALMFLLSYRAVDWENYFDFFVYGTLVSFYLISAAWLGHSLSGSRMSQIAITAMIIAGPRTFLYVIGVIIETAMPYLLLYRYDFLFAPHKYNLALSYLCGIGATVTSVIYTLLLTFIYLGLALWLIKKKPSEAAGRPTWTSKMETLVRVLLACALSLPAIIGCLLLYFSHVGYGLLSHASEVEYMLLIIIFYSLAVVVYFLYEIVQTKKVKNAFKHWKGLGWVGLFNLLFILFIIILHKSVTGVQPDASEIESVTLIDVRNERDFTAPKDESIDYGARFFIDERNEEIFQGLIYDIPLTSDYVKSIVSDELHDAILDGIDYDIYRSAFFKTSALQVHISGPIREDWSIDDLTRYYEVRDMMCYKAALKIELKNGKTIYRQLCLPRILFEELTEQNEFVERLQNLDFEEMINSYKNAWEIGAVYNNIRVGGGSSLYDVDNKLMDALGSDIKAMTNEQKRDLLFHPTKCIYGRNIPLDSNGWISVIFDHFETSSELRLAISAENCPSFYPYVADNVKKAYADWAEKEASYLQPEGDANVSN